MRAMMHRLSGERRGAVTMIAAGSLLALIGSTALAVDIGNLYLAKRRLQGAADAAALAAASDSDSAAQAARRTVDANGLAAARVDEVTQGRYAADPALSPDARYAAGGDPADAAQVTLSQDVPLFFAGVLTGRHQTGISARATAARIDYAAFSIGSRLASVQGGLPDALLSALTGSSINLSVMDYNALAGADIDLLAFTDALRTQAHLDAASFGETLNTAVTLPAALNALASVAGGPAAAAALRQIALQVSPTTIRLSDLIDLGPYAGQDHADPDTAIRADGYSILREMLQLANGHRQVALDLGVTLPGLTSTRLWLAIGERPAHSPWLAITQAHDVVVRTAQARLYLDSRVGGVASLGIASLRLPILIELAEAQAKLAAISCAGGSTKASVSLDAQPAVGSIAVADIDTGALDDFQTPLAEAPALLAHALLLDVRAQSHIALGGVTWQRVSFSPSDIAAGRIRSVSTGDLSQGIATSLLSRADIRVTALGLGVNLSLATQLVGAVLQPLSPALDGLLDQVTGLLGVHVGQADLRIDGVRCGKATLVG